MMKQIISDVNTYIVRHLKDFINLHSNIEELVVLKNEAIVYARCIAHHLIVGTGKPDLPLLILLTAEDDVEIYSTKLQSFNKQGEAMYAEDRLIKAFSAPRSIAEILDYVIKCFGDDSHV